MQPGDNQNGGQPMTPPAQDPMQQPAGDPMTPPAGETPMTPPAAPAGDPMTPATPAEAPHEGGDNQAPQA